MKQDNRKSGSYLLLVDDVEETDLAVKKVLWAHSRNTGKPDLRLDGVVLYLIIGIQVILCKAIVPLLGVKAFVHSIRLNCSKSIKVQQIQLKMSSRD